tara:strand:- start:1709 stop:2347 length:639 start_codon:yes stop_codon:yes gene_type:complete
MSSEREIYEEALLNGDMNPKQIDKEMSWRTNTAERHYRNHMGEFHLTSNHTCKLCTDPKRAEYENRFFADGTESDAIAEELGVSENSVYHHMKFHFQPLVQRSAATEVAIQIGGEMTTLRTNVERLNQRLNDYLDETSVHEDGFVRDAVTLHKEVRESIKDLMKMEDQWGTKSDTPQINQTINVLKVELSKESPETWKRIRESLLEHGEDAL